MKVTLPGETLTPTPETVVGRIRRLFFVTLGGLALLALGYFLYDELDIQHRFDKSLERWGALDNDGTRTNFENLSLFVKGTINNSPLTQTSLPQLVIDVPFKNMRKIYAKRDLALQRRQLVQGPDDFVNGKVRIDDRVVPIKLRLKGDDTDHLTGKKWSFRIRVRNDEQLFGMRRFSIQHPKTRAYQAEALFFEAAKRMGVMVPRYMFVDVVLNGEAVGVMALEEFFAKELVEHNRRREGVIVRYTESDLWAANDSFFNYGAGWEGAFDYFGNAEIDAIASGKVAESETLSRQYEVAQGLLKGFSDGALQTSTVFEPKQLGAFIAVADVFGAWHPLRWHNMRFYFNPISLKLEPVAYDASLQYRYEHNMASVIHRDPLTIRMLGDQQVRESYLATLSELLSELSSGSLQSMLSDKDEAILESIRSEFRVLSAFPTDYLLKRASALNDRFRSDEKVLKDNLHVFLEEEKTYYPILVRGALQSTDQRLSLYLQNAVPMDVVVDRVDWVNADGTRRPATSDTLPVSVPARGIRSKSQKFNLAIESPPNEAGWNIEVVSRLAGRNWHRISQPALQAAALSKSPLPSASIDQTLERFSFLKFDPLKSQIIVPTGEWTLSESLIVPPGYELIVSAGAVLKFAKDAALVSYGPLNMNGTVKAPVKLLPSNGEGWLGIVVMDSPTRSSLSHTHVDRTLSVTMDGWTLTGGVNFYRSDVVIKNSLLSNSLGEDALNIIESEFHIEDSNIDGTVSDAFDSDFSKGTVTGGLFANIGSAGGGDAIDVSGSNVKVSGVRFERISDKALSIGENSRLEAVDVDISGAGTGAASKDGSVLELRNTTINRASFAGVTAYIKKAEYGPAQVFGENVQVSNVELPVLAQTGSRVELDGTVYETQEVDVDALYETVMRPGLRR